MQVVSCHGLPRHVLDNAARYIHWLPSSVCADVMPEVVGLREVH
jgi:hypothetical protein